MWLRRAENSPQTDVSFEFNAAFTCTRTITTRPAVTAVDQSDEMKEQEVELVIAEGLSNKMDDQEVEQLKLPSYLKAESWRKWCSSGFLWCWTIHYELAKVWKTFHAWSAYRKTLPDIRDGDPPQAVLNSLWSCEPVLIGGDSRSFSDINHETDSVAI